MIIATLCSAEFRPQSHVQLSQPGDGQRLKMAKLNLYQCLASAGPQYDDVCCLGEHALKDTGYCVMSAAGEEPADKLAVADSRPAPGGGMPVAVTAVAAMSIVPVQ